MCVYVYTYTYILTKYVHKYMHADKRPAGRQDIALKLPRRFCRYQKPNKGR